ncbi:MAG: lipopolysaccharide heptosyltransferase II [Candidatus Rokubacteria bacterium]|nr:lipopolysaccharide heptosyltransferase II [Candidatus Rokubacteria bacterium]MBI3105445.1 lipopolysaccharide heptosyltransferase II [Candidatus Rokubacteria bacterium]
MGPVIVVRAPNWLGDTVMALPALSALRVGEPRARIAIVGRWARLLAGQGVADLLLDYPGHWVDRRRFARALGDEPADLALLLPNSFESALAARRWRARRRVGFAGDGRGPLLTDALPLPAPRLHQVDEYRLLVRAAGVDTPGEWPTWRLAPRAPAEAEVDSLLAEAGLRGRARLVGLHPGAAGGGAKRWAGSSYAALADALADGGFAPLLLGAPADLAAGQEIASSARSRPPSLAGRDRAELLPHLLSRLCCLVSGDTGVAHLGAALGVPTVTLFGPTDPRRTAPRSPQARIVSPGAPCAPCFRSECPIDHPCMRAITVADVEQRVREAIAS